MSAPLIIGLSGRAGSGKSATAALLTEHYGYTEASFASALRQEVGRRMALGAWLVEGQAEISDLMMKVREADLWAKPTSPDARRLLQLYGTEFRRAQDQAYWLKSLRLNPGERYVISDVRFPNEAGWVRVLGGTLWTLTGRAAEDVSPHESERHIPQGWPLDNSGTLEALAMMVAQKMASYEEKEKTGAPAQV